MAKRPRPPKSRRVCPVCNRITTFSYNPCIFHSCCEVCGAHIGALKPKEKENKKQ